MTLLRVVVALLSTTCAVGFNILVVGGQGGGKSRVVNAALRTAGLVAHPVVVGGKAATKPTTLKSSRYCAPGGESNYLCWYDTPGMDVCSCLAQYGPCDSLSYLQYLMKGVVPGSPWPPTTSTPTSETHIPDLVLFISSGSAASAAACGRRLSLHLANITAPTPVIVGLTTADGSTPISVDSLPVVPTPIFSSQSPTVEGLLEVIEPYVREAGGEDGDEGGVQDADDSVIRKLTAEEAALGARLEAWSAEKQHRHEENRKADLAAWETATTVLIVGLGSVSVSLILRLITYLFTTGLGTTKRTYSWVTIAGMRLSRLGIAVTKTQSQSAAKNSAEASKYLLSASLVGVKYLRVLLEATGKGFVGVLVVLWGVFTRLLAWVWGCVGHGCNGLLKGVEAGLRFFPQTKQRFIEYRNAYKASQAEAALKKRGVDDAKVCTSCMTPIGVQTTGVEVQTTPMTPPSMSPEAVLLTPRTALSESTTTVSDVAEEKNKNPEKKISFRMRFEAWWRSLFTNPGVDEVVDVLWTDGVTYEATVLSVKGDDADVKFEGKSEESGASLSVVPLDRVTRRPFVERWGRLVKIVKGVVGLPGVVLVGLIESAEGWREKQRKIAKDRRRQAELDKMEPWDKRKVDLDINSKSPLRKRRNSLPVVAAPEVVPIIDFPSEHSTRRTAGREGGFFMDTVGAPVGTTFQDICSAADTLQSTLHKRLSEQPEDPSPYEALKQATSQLPITTTTPIRVPYAASPTPRRSIPPTTTVPRLMSPPPSYPAAMIPQNPTPSPRYCSIRRAIGTAQGYGHCNTPPPPPPQPAATMRLKDFSSVGSVDVSVPPPPSTPVSSYNSCATGTPTYGSVSDVKDDDAMASTVFTEETPVDMGPSPVTVPTPMELPLPLPSPSPRYDPSPMPSPATVCRADKVETPRVGHSPPPPQPQPPLPTQNMWGTLTGWFHKAAPVVQNLVAMVEPPTPSVEPAISEYDSAGDQWVPSTAASRPSSLKSSLKNPGSEASRHSTVYTTDSSEASGLPWIPPVGPRAAPSQARRTENDSLYSAFQRERGGTPRATDALFGGAVPKNSFMRFQGSADTSLADTSHRSGFYSQPTTPKQVHEVRARSNTTKMN